jgi:hypothetical protein
MPTSGLPRAGENVAYTPEKHTPGYHTQVFTSGDSNRSPTALAAKGQVFDLNAGQINWPSVAVLVVTAEQFVSRG